MRRIAVTGAGGYVGGTVVAAGAAAGEAVIAVSRKGAGWLDSEGVAAVHVRSYDEVGSALAGVDAVVHLAGANEVEARADPEGTTSATVSAAGAVASACAEAGINRLVYLSTVHVYGAALTPGALIDESTEPRPVHPYAEARLASERAIQERAGETEVVVLRLTNSIGPPPHPSVDRWSLVSNDLCRQATEGGPLRLLSSGRQWRDFIALDDVARIVLSAVDPLALEPGLYNLASGRPMTVRSFADLVAGRARLAGLGDLEVIAPEDGAKEVSPYLVSTVALDRRGLRAEVPLEEAVDATLDFCLGVRSNP